MKNDTARLLLISDLPMELPGNSTNNCTIFDNDRNPQTDSDYDWILAMRNIIIFISTTALVLNIILIISKKQYKFNTIRLFLLVQIFYAISLVSVTPHNVYFNLNQKQRPEDDLIPLYMQCLTEKGVAFASAFQGFINLTCYSISYWFAVCITLYIRLVLQNNHKKFMKKNGTLIFVVISAIILWYLIPFVFSFLVYMPFSFGPTGYSFQHKNYLFYAGIVSRKCKEEFLPQFLVIIWMLILPFALFVYHLKLLCKNYSYISRLKQLDQLNPRQFFLIRSGKLSFMIFSVQIMNVVKLILSFFAEANDFLTWLVFMLNVVFDLLALVLVWMYFKFYYKTGRKLQEHSQVMNKTVASTFGTLHAGIL